jgi:hypothetical protein
VEIIEVDPPAGNPPAPALIHLDLTCASACEAVGEGVNAWRTFLPGLRAPRLAGTVVDEDDNFPASVELPHRPHRFRHFLSEWL